MTRKLPHVVAALALFAGWPAQSQVIQRFDPIYEHNSGGDHHLRGDAVWVVYARCAAFHRNADLFVQNYREKLAAKRATALPEQVGMYAPSAEQEEMIRQEQARQAQTFIADGLRVMAQDRPGQNVEAEFRAQVDREYADIVAFPHMPETSMEMYDHRCRAFDGSMQQYGLTSARRQVRGAGIPVSGALTQEMINRIRARDGY